MVSDKIIKIEMDGEKFVLILVLMEYGLWQISAQLSGSLIIGLNPCSNGIWSLTIYACVQSTTNSSVLILVLMEYGLWHWNVSSKSQLQCLNPCSNGIWSLTPSWCCLCHFQQVLILVLMEYGLWLKKGNLIPANAMVLILVLMEYGLWPTPRELFWGLRVRLNPCSNGIWSLTSKIKPLSEWITS